MGEISNDKLAEIINSGFENQKNYFDQQFITHKDIDEKLGAQTELISADIKRIDTMVEKFRVEVQKEFHELRELIASIDTRTDEDTTIALKKIDVFEKELAKLKKQLSAA